MGKILSKWGIKMIAEQKELLRVYNDAKKRLYESDPDASYDRHDTLLNAYKSAKANLIAAGYNPDMERGLFAKLSNCIKDLCVKCKAR